MNKAFFSMTVIVLLNYSCTNAQQPAVKPKIPVQTTIDEFNYINKMLWDDIRLGRGVLAGYSMQELSSFYTDGKGNTAKLYYYNKGSEHRAIILECKEPNGNTYYHCVPGSNSSPVIWSNAKTDFNSFDCNWKQFITWALTRVISEDLLYN